MRKYSIFFFAAIMAIASCSRQEHDSSRITGSVENPGDSVVEIFYYTDYVTNSTRSAEAELDANNSFEAEIPMGEAAFVHMRIPRRTITLYLEPGADVNIVFDAQDSEKKPELTGHKAGESSFLLSYNQDVESKFGQMSMLNRARELNPVEFASFVRDAYEEKMAYLREYPRYTDLDAGFVSLMETNMKYEKFNHLMEYPYIRRQLDPAGEIPELPGSYFDFLDDDELFSDEKTSSRAYVNFVSTYLHHHLEQSAPEYDTDEDYMRIRYETALELFAGETLDIALAGALVSMLNFGDYQQAVAFYDRFVEDATTEKYREIVGEVYENVSSLAPGMPAPGFTLTGIDGEQVSLEDFRGKVVYLDFWASWCGPCMQQVPYAKELKKRMEAYDDLVFLYISVDTDEEAWRRTVREQEIEGVHLNVPGFRHEVPQSYNLQGVPTFYLIGRDGNIADNRPPRPSNENIDRAILAALSDGGIPIPGRAGLKGQISNLGGTVAEISFFRDFINNDRKVLSLDAGPDGRFDLEFDVPGPVMASLSVRGNSYPLYLEAGFDPGFSMDASLPAGQVEFSGWGSRENRLLHDYNEEVLGNISRSFLNEKARNLSSYPYLAFADSIETVKRDYIESYDGTGDMSTAFLNYMETEILTEKYQMLLAYPDLYEGDEMHNTPAAYYDFLEDATRSNEGWLLNPNYVNFLLTYLDFTAETDRGEYASLHHRNYELAGRHLQDKNRYYIQALSVSRELNSGDIQLAMDMYDEFMENNPYEEYSESLESALDNLRALWEGSPAPEFTMTDINGNEVSLSDYRGKVVYLKFWASWCGPCMRQVPPAAELKERFAGEEDLVFMYVSIDTDPSAWENSVAGHGITGVHMRTPGRERGVPALYNVRWIPSFYLIGRDGNIFDHRPPMPSDDGIDEALTLALNES